MILVGGVVAGVWKLALYAAIPLAIFIAAVVSDIVSAAVVAGIFSVVNTMLNASLIARSRKQDKLLNETRNIVERRKTPREDNGNGKG